MAAERINASDLTVGEYVPTGLPIICCGTEMELTIGADTDDWECGTCLLAVVIDLGRVDSIGR